MNKTTRPVRIIKRADVLARAIALPERPQPKAEPRKHVIENLFFGPGGLNRWRAQNESRLLRQLAELSGR